MSDETPVTPDAIIAELLEQGAAAPPRHRVVGPPTKPAAPLPTSSEIDIDSDAKTTSALRLVDNESTTRPESALLEQVTHPSRPTPSTSIETRSSPFQNPAWSSDSDPTPPPALVATPEPQLATSTPRDASVDERHRPVGIPRHRQRVVGIYLPAYLRSRVEELRAREGISRGALLVDAFQRHYLEVLDRNSPAPAPTSPFGPTPRTRRSVNDGATVVFYLRPDALDAMNEVAERLDVSLSQAASLVLECYLGSSTSLSSSI